jgi:hypothetical protein
MFAAMMRSGNHRWRWCSPRHGDHHLAEEGRPSHRGDYITRLVDSVERSANRDDDDRSTAASRTASSTGQVRAGQNNWPSVAICSCCRNGAGICDSSVDHIERHDAQRNVATVAERTTSSAIFELQPGAGHFNSIRGADDEPAGSRDITSGRTGKGTLWPHSVVSSISENP